jgi:hypothetical protein
LSHKYYAGCQSNNCIACWRDERTHLSEEFARIGGQTIVVSQIPRGLSEYQMNSVLNNSSSELGRDDQSEEFALII